VRVHGVARQQDGAGAAASATGRRCPRCRVRHADQHRDECGSSGERDPHGHVEEIADRDEALRVTVSESVPRPGR
jgi:hypothetical protein